MKNFKIVYCLFFLSLFFINIKTNIGTYGFKNFPNYYFVETGTFGGDGLQIALNSGCFTELYSMEVQQSFVVNAQNRFRKNRNVHILHGDSKCILWGVIKDLNKPITFWLDAHIFPPMKGIQNCPLLEELDQIKKHPIKTHTIIIDDQSCCGQHAFDYLTQQDLINKIKEINSNYKITFLPGGNDDEVPNNVLVAYVEK